MSKIVKGGVFGSLAVAPTAVAYGVGPALIGTSPAYSDGAAWMVMLFSVPSGGTADDWDVINSVIQDAPDGATLVLTNGSTYTIDKPITLKTGQKIIGNGATIKRANQTATTTTTSITAGSTTSITVASATGLRAGQKYLIRQASVNSYAYGIIQSVVGTTVTFTAALAGSNLSGTSDCGVSFAIFTMPDDSGLFDVIFDGNQANNGIAHWYVTHEVLVSGSNVTIEGCTFSDSAGEAICEWAADIKSITTHATSGGTTITPANTAWLSVGDLVTVSGSGETQRERYPQVISAINGGTGEVTIAAPGWTVTSSAGWQLFRYGTGRKYLRNKIIRAQGNGIHLSGSAGTVIDGNSIIRSCLNSSYIGHSGGAICWSNEAYGAIVTNNVITDNTVAGINLYAKIGNGDCLIQGNRIESCTGNAVKVTPGPGGTIHNVRIDSNQITNCGDVIVQQITAGTAILGLTFTGNSLMNTKASFIRGGGFTISGNQIESTGTTGNGVTLNSIGDTIFYGNVIKGWSYAISISATESAFSVKLLINGNSFLGFSGRGMDCNGYAAELMIAGNNINVPSGAIGILARAKNIVKDNTIVVNGANTGIYLADDAVAVGNFVRRTSTGSTIKNWSGNGNIAFNNFLNVAYDANSSTPDAMTTTYGNYTIP